MCRLCYSTSSSCPSDVLCKHTGSSPQCWLTSVTLTVHAADHVNQFPRILDTISTSTRPAIHFVTRELYTSCYCHASQAVLFPCLYGVSLLTHTHLSITQKDPFLLPQPSLICFPLLPSSCSCSCSRSARLCPQPTSLSHNLHPELSMSLCYIIPVGPT